MICSDIWHKYHSGYFKIVSNFTRLTAREITYNNFEISLVVFMPNTTTNHAITNTYTHMFSLQIDRSVFASYGTHALNYFSVLGVFMPQGRRTRR